jgi:hypothetical protein
MMKYSNNVYQYISVLIQSCIDSEQKIKGRVNNNKKKMKILKKLFYSVWKAWKGRINKNENKKNNDFHEKAVGVVAVVSRPWSPWPQSVTFPSW